MKAGRPGGNLARVHEGEGKLNSPFWRKRRLAGPAFVLRTLALAIVALLLTSQLEITSAEEPASTVHIRGEASESPPSDSESKHSADQDTGMYKVGERVAPVAPQADSNGDIIVGFALSYVGYPYVWAGNTPAGFDCSGFTEFVVLNTLGFDIGHGIEGQPGAGAWVDWGSWQPGDLVLFQNTYRAGLSHVGIYVGDGLFVHAENEGTGVVVSSMYSDYYGPRYWGAVRVG
jgi:cell wall-associated NlpC family hydrolase